MHKTRRQQKILSLIRARRIGTQQELTAMLEEPIPAMIRSGRNPSDEKKRYARVEV